MTRLPSTPASTPAVLDSPSSTPAYRGPMSWWLAYRPAWLKASRPWEPTVGGAVWEKEGGRWSGGQSAAVGLRRKVSGGSRLSAHTRLGGKEAAQRTRPPGCWTHSDSCHASN